MQLMGAAMRPVVRFAMRRASDPKAMRRHFAISAKLWFRHVPFSLFLPTTFGPRKAEALWVSAEPTSHSKVLLYFHGGGYLAGSPHTHKMVVARLSRMAGLRAFVPSYRLAPEHPLSAACEDADLAFEHLLSKGYRAQDIVLGGDSAGGGIALGLLARLCQRGQPPAGCFAWSPFCDQSFSGDSIQENGDKDHFFPGDRVEDLAERILGGADPKDPKISPLFAAYPNCPPVFLQVSDSEILRDDSVRMDQKLRAEGAQCQLEVYSAAPHVWHLFDGWFPEARAAIRKTAAFVNSLPPLSDDS
ncbi:MAG: alpha/beta hydrolase [Thalassovita sp.]